MGRIVISCFKPKPGKAELLSALMRRYLAQLRYQGLATSRASMMMTASDGTFVEVFEWSSHDAIERAQHNPEVASLLKEFHDVCEYVPLNEVPEASQLIAEFESSE